MSAEPHHENQLKWQENKLEYLRFRYKVEPTDLVVDLGSYDGIWAEEFNRQHGCMIVCVEPTDSIFRLQHCEWAVIINKAANTHEGKVTFGGCFYYSSLFEGDAKYGFKDFPCFDVNTILDKPIKLLKINCEGMEYDLMNHIIDAGLAKNIENVQIQFHVMPGFDHEGEWEKIAKKLEKTHAIEWRCGFCWESWYLIKNKES